MHKDIIDISLDSIDSFERVTSILIELEKQLPRQGLSEFYVFNKVYLLITSGIAEAAKEDYFDNPSFIETFTVSFARHYFQAIHDVAHTASQPVTAWQCTSAAAHNPRGASPAMLLLMGANAHINHDLPLVLSELLDDKHATQLFADVLKIDKILIRSGKDVLPMFSEPNRLLNGFKNRFVWLYHRPVMWLILYWRVRAWHDYKSIRSEGLTHAGYARRSIRIAKFLQPITRLVG